jgi:hypothetical protein
LSKFSGGLERLRGDGCGEISNKFSESASVARDERVSKLAGARMGASFISRGPGTRLED